MAEKINARKGDGKQSESQITANAVMKGLAVKERFLNYSLKYDILKWH